MLSRLIVEIANHPLLGDEVVFRGSTCLHKLNLPTPRRYSEDLDYVQVTTSGIGPVLEALREVGGPLDLEPRNQVSQHPKVQFRSTFGSGAPMRVKVEINTYETSPARPLIRLPHTVESPWWNGQADVQTLTSPELVATKLRALHQRRKGGDLFDLLPLSPRYPATTTSTPRPPSSRPSCSLASNGRRAHLRVRRQKLRLPT